MYFIERLDPPLARPRTSKFRLASFQRVEEIPLSPRFESLVTTQYAVLFKPAFIRPRILMPYLQWKIIGSLHFEKKGEEVAE